MGHKKLKWIRKSGKHNKLHFSVVTVTPETQLLLLSVSLFYSPWLDSCWFLNVSCIVCTILIDFFTSWNFYFDTHSSLGSFAIFSSSCACKNAIFRPSFSFQHTMVFQSLVSSEHRWRIEKMKKHVDDLENSSFLRKVKEFIEDVWNEKISFHFAVSSKAAI